MPHARYYFALLATPFLFTAAVRAQEVPGPVPADAWITATESNADGTELGMFSWNPQTGAWAERKWTRGAVAHVAYKNPVTGEYAEYALQSLPGRPAAGAGPAQVSRVTIGTLSPSEADNLRLTNAQPFTFATFVADARDRFGPDGIKVTKVPDDRAMDRYTLVATDAIQKPTAFLTRDDQTKHAATLRVKLSLPATLWVDKQTQVIREIVNGNATSRITLRVGAPPIRNIFDAGAPAAAEVFDTRPDVETVAAYDRIVRRMRQALPDGATAVLSESKEKDAEPRRTLDIFSQAGNIWMERTYSVDRAAARGKLAVPDDWTAAGVDAFFRNLAVTLPTRQIRSDGVTAFQSQFDSQTGEEFHTGSGGRGPAARLAGAEKVTGAAARLAESGPSQLLFPADMNSIRYTLGLTIDLITDNDHPGLIALRARDRRGGPDSLLSESLYWFDPQHDDRPVHILFSIFEDPWKPGVNYREEMQFGPYATLPAPDGRSYATQWVGTVSEADKEGHFAETHRQASTFHFFPGKALPEIPKKPASP